MQTVLDRFVSTGVSPNVIAAVITPEGVWAGAAGKGGTDGRASTTADEFMIASITKTFTAALIMRLVEEGKMDLDKPLSTYLGSTKIDSNGATVREALAMHSGIPGTTDSSNAKVDAKPAKVWTTAEVAAEFPAPVSPPGGSFLESNPTYKMLGIAAAHVTGKPLAAAMRAEVLDPAGSPKTLLVQSGDVKTPKPWALPPVSDDGAVDIKDYGAGGALPYMSNATFSYSASGMVGDVESVASWVWQLYAGKVVSAASLATMSEADGEGNGSGIDDFSSQDGTTAHGHSGTKAGYESTYVVLPDKKTVVVVFVNQQSSDVAGVASGLLAASEG